jgi:hypothetical protein
MCKSSSPTIGNSLISTLKEWASEGGLYAIVKGGVPGFLAGERRGTERVVIDATRALTHIMRN